MENKQYKVTFATGSRADYGIVRNYIKKLNDDPNIDFSILATGALLDESFGHAIDIVKQDGFKIDYECPYTIKSDKLSDTTHIMAEVLDKFGNYFEDHKYDLVIILGDRYEIYSVSIAAAMHHLPILHIHGGEVTLSNYDEFIRHSITKMSRFHFTSTEEYRNRVIQLGEDPETVFYLGALGAENCLAIDINNVSEEVKNLPDKKTFTVLYHPETLNDQDPVIQIQQVLEAVKPFVGEYEFCFIGSNADTKSDGIKKMVKQFCEDNEHTHYFENLHPDGYHALVKKSIALIGNSSSGIIEVPSLGAWTVNIGNRQTGRVKGNSIIDVPCSCENITVGIQKTIDNLRKDIINPYFVDNSSLLYYNKTKSILSANIDKYKNFYDLNFVK